MHEASTTRSNKHPAAAPKGLGFRIWVLNYCRTTADMQPELGAKPTVTMMVDTRCGTAVGTAEALQSASLNNPKTSVCVPADGYVTLSDVDTVV